MKDETEPNLLRTAGSLEKTLVLGKIEGRRRQGSPKMRCQRYDTVWWHHLLNEHEFVQTLGDAEGQGSLACFSRWGSQRVWRLLAMNNNMIMEATNSGDLQSKRWEPEQPAFSSRIFFSHLFATDKILALSPVRCLFLSSCFYILLLIVILPIWL